jgi:type I restriction enzyme S subunit
MNPQTLLEHFDLLADIPGAVPKLRELVLELAVRGRLSHGVEELQTVQLSEVADPSAAKKVAASDIPDDAWILDLEDIDGARGVVLERHHFAERRSLSTKAMFQKGDVLYGKLRPYLNKVVVAEDGGYCTTEIVPIRPGRMIDARFLRYALRSRSFLDYAAEKNYGMKMPRLGSQHIEEAPIPLPPLAEQRRIVAKVDELMAILDDLEARQRQRDERRAALSRAALARFADAPTPANLDMLFYPSPCPRAPVREKKGSHRATEPQSTSSHIVQPADLRKTILTLAVQGKLVLQDPNDEPAEAIIGRNEELSDDASFEIPDQWTWTQLSQLAEINGGFAFKSTAYTDEGMRVVRISDFDEFGFKDHKVVRHPFTPDLQKFTLAESNILMAMTGGTVGKSYFVRSLPEPMVVNQRVAIIKVSANVNPSYVDIAIRSELTQEVIRKAKNSTNDNISMGDIKGFAIPLPPLAEQRRIVARVEELMALVDDLEAQLAAARETGARLLDAVVAELTQPRPTNSPIHNPKSPIATPCRPAGRTPDRSARRPSSSTRASGRRPPRGT